MRLWPPPGCLPGALQGELISPQMHFPWVGWLGKQNPHKDLVSAGSGAVLVFGEQTLCALLWQDRLTSRVCSLHCREEVGLFLSLLLKGYATLGSLLNFSEPQFPFLWTDIKPSNLHNQKPNKLGAQACNLSHLRCRSRRIVCSRPFWAIYRVSSKPAWTI